MFSIPEEELTDDQKVFLDYYYRLLPINDSDCPMNKICHYIEGIDFNIKQKVHSSFGFDYTILQSEGFTPNRKIYEKIYETVEAHVKKWNDGKKELRDKTKPEEGFDKMAAYTALRDDLEEISPNDEIIANHLVTLFYEDKPSYNKNILWEIYGKTVFNILKSKTKTAYFPMKNPNGTLTFLDEQYSIEKVTIINPDKKKDNNEEQTTEENCQQIVKDNMYIEINNEEDLFDNIKEERLIDD